MGARRASRGSSPASFARADHESAVASAGRADLIDCVCELDSELLVVLSPRRFLAVIEQGLAVTS